MYISKARYVALCGAFGCLITLAPQAAQAGNDCHTSQQRTADELIARLNIAGGTPKEVSVAERACLIAVAGHVLGRYPGPLKEASSEQNEKLRAAVIATTGKYDPTSIADHTLFSQLAADLAQQCVDSVQQTLPQSLAAEVAARCGIVSLPGAPKGLGRATALRESGHAEGGYADISSDPGAGGWTYGRYQIASEAGGMTDFLAVLSCTGDLSRCLPTSFRQLGTALSVAGGVDGARKRTKLFEETWTELSFSDRTMQQAQESYQALVVWQPIKKFFSGQLNIDLDKMSCGLREAAFSVQTQHSSKSAHLIFSEAVKTAGTTDSAAIVKAANAWRLARLGQKKADGGFYSTYGDICVRGMPSKDGVSQAYACSYLDGVRNRWTSEGTELSKLTAVECPLP